MLEIRAVIRTIFYPRVVVDFLVNVHGLTSFSVVVPLFRRKIITFFEYEEKS